MVILSKTRHCQTHEPQQYRAMQPCAIRTIFRCVEEKRMMGAGIVRGGKLIRGLPCTVQPITSHTTQLLVPTILLVPRSHKYEAQHRQ